MPPQLLDVHALLIQQFFELLRPLLFHAAAFLLVLDVGGLILLSAILLLLQGEQLQHPFRALLPHAPYALAQPTFLFPCAHDSPSPRALCSSNPLSAFVLHFATQSFLLFLTLDELLTISSDAPSLQDVYSTPIEQASAHQAFLHQLVHC